MAKDTSVPTISDHKSIRSDEERIGRLRVDHYLGDIYTEWFLECRDIQTKLGISGNIGGSVAVQKSLEALDKISVEKIDSLLDELGKAIRTRRKIWYRLHDYAIEQIPLKLGDATYRADEMMWRGSEGPSGVDVNRVPKIISDLRNRVALHKAGWTAPKPDPFEDRYPITSKLLLALFAFALGILAGPATEFLFRESDLENPSVDSPSPPPTTAPPQPAPALRSAI
ncbi:hypothetical protein [uncultured Erythrobacter sp.]|uniref:hypothetical protein n=1 Tax=uncultured Erythrobacter sp. TaxID=263913 RepID=UPI002610C04A|nr:hypothetical protein [uncultured Erythrobacter sp.]